MDNDIIECLDGVGTLVRCYDLNEGDWIADDTGEPVRVLGEEDGVVFTEDGDIEVPEGMLVRRLAKASY